MDPILQKKRRRTGGYDDGTMSYSGQAPTTSATSSGAGVDTTTPYAHSPATNQYWNPQTVDRQGYREEGRKQYGVGSDYYKNLDQQGKLNFINKVGGGTPSGGYKGGQQLLAGLQHGGNGALANLAQDARAQRERDALIDQAYSKAANSAYSLEGIKDPAILSQLGKAPPHTQWREVFDNVTGKSLGYYADDQKSGRGGWFNQSWSRNQPAWQAGIGAVSGLITGGPVGAVVGGAAGWASGDKVKQQQDAQRKLDRLQNKQDIKNNVNPNRSTSLRDIARSRAAGAGTFNYTEQAEG